MRWLAILTALLGPLWIAITFHQSCCPELLMTYWSPEKVYHFGRYEALIMEISLEVLREAGLRLPKLLDKPSV